MVAISFDRHLYYPLLSLEDKDAVPLKMRPLAFDSPSEVQFVEDLQAFYGSDKGKEVIGGRSLYLLRNASSESKGLGFALAGNFYPDFLLWLVDDQTGQQWLSFIDPKGLRNISIDNPKLQLYKEIKSIESEINKNTTDNNTLTLDAFILSPTKFTDLLNIGNRLKQSDLEEKHILFMEVGGDYLQGIFSRIH